MFLVSNSAFLYNNFNFYIYNRCKVLHKSTLLTTAFCLKKTLCISESQMTLKLGKLTLYISIRFETFKRVD